jgi:hypothetical protein
VEEVRERVSKTLELMTKYAEVMQRIDCYARELNKYLYTKLFKPSAEILRARDEVRVPLEKRVEVPDLLRPLLGDNLEVGRLSVTAVGVFVMGREGDILQSIHFNEDVTLRHVIWLSLIVEDWSAVLGAVQSAGVREAVEKLARAAEVVRLALEGECAPQPPPGCGAWRFSERYKRLILDAVEVLLEEKRAERAPHETVAGRFVAKWEIPLFYGDHLRTLHGLSITLRVERGVEVPGWLAALVSGIYRVAPPFTVEAVRADEAGVSVYVRGRTERGEERARLEPISRGSTSVRELLFAAYFTEEEDWARLTAERKRLLDTLGETYCRVRAAALLHPLLA